MSFNSYIKPPCVEPDGTPCLSRHPGCQNPETCERYAEFRKKIEQSKAGNDIDHLVADHFINFAAKRAKRNNVGSRLRRRGAQH